MSEQNRPRRYVLFVCLIATLGGLLFGYDTAVIAGAIGFLKTRFNLTPALEGWAASCALLGCVVGVSISGPFGDRFGRKRLLLLAGTLFALSAVGTALPPNLGWFVFFRIIGGVGIGVASAAAPMYIAEIAPSGMRGMLVSVNQLAIVSGMLVVYFVNYLIASAGNEAWNVAYGWRWMFGSGLAPSTLFVILLVAIPESPRWLTGKGRAEEARNILIRVNGPETAGRELQAIRTSLGNEVGSRTRLFQPGFQIVLTTGVVLAVLQQVTGINVFLYYAPEIFKKLGSATHAALLQTVTIGATNLLFTIVAIYTVDRWGRKPLMLIGASGMGLCLIGMGSAAWAQQTAVWILFFILGYIACFALSVGPVTWVILSEIFPTRVRAKALGFATLCLWLANFAVSQTFPILNENTWLVETFHHGFPFFIYAAMCLVELLFVWRLVPETKGQTLEDIERLWPPRTLPVQVAERRGS
jgi:SP family xylose:H+ symportor-like MFS transporter